LRGATEGTAHARKADEEGEEEVGREAKTARSAEEKAWLSAAAEARELVSLELGRSISRTAQKLYYSVWIMACSGVSVEMMRWYGRWRQPTALAGPS
jgi:hypothetical protein